MKKHIFLWIFGCLLTMGGLAQQVPVMTLFAENEFLYNPAVAGIDEGFKARMNNRFQWVGFADAPMTNLLSAYGPHKSKNIGYGGTIGYDALGPTGRFTLNGAFAVNFSLGGERRLSAGINFGFIQYRVDGSQLLLDSPEDPARIDDPYAPATMMSAFLPDAAAGLMLYHPRWYVGVSALQLFGNNIKFNGQNSGLNRLKRHFYGLAGYKWDISEKFRLEPALLVTALEASPVKLGLSLRAVCLEQFWAGLGTRNTFNSLEDVSFMLGYIHRHRLNIGLGYDYSPTAIRQFTTGTIELMIGYNFDPIRKQNTTNSKQK